MDAEMVGKFLLGVAVFGAFLVCVGMVAERAERKGRRELLSSLWGDGPDCVSLVYGDTDLDDLSGVSRALHPAGKRRGAGVRSPRPWLN